MERHGRITKKEMKEAQDTPIDKNLVKRTVEERNDAMTDTPDNEYASYINYVKQEITQNKAFKGQSLNDIMTSGLKIYTNMDKDVQKHYKSQLITVHSTRIKTKLLVHL